MALREGSKNAIADSICKPCRDRQHTQCTQELAVVQNGEVSELIADGFTMEKVEVPFCVCYSKIDIHT